MRMCNTYRALATLLTCALAACNAARPNHPPPSVPSVLVLGIAQDGGVPQAGSFGDTRWNDEARTRKVVSLGIIDPRSGKRWMIDATPDFRSQSLDLFRASGGAPTPVVDGIFLTHAHMGHYTGLMFLGHESIGARGVPVYAMPRMREFVQTNGPWSQLVKYHNIELRPLEAGVPVRLTDDVSVTPIMVPHRQEFSEVVGFRIDGPSRRVLWLPDIDSWEAWDAQGTRLEDVLNTVDVAYVDGTFFANGELPGRDMTGFPHPFITHTMQRLAALPPAARDKIRFIHLNHSNPALEADSDARRAIEKAGMHVANEGELQTLSER
jgi:pyrroloquinoline quinone biosynthesis protein B